MEALVVEHPVRGARVEAEDAHQLRVGRGIDPGDRVRGVVEPWVPEDDRPGGVPGRGDPDVRQTTFRP